MRRDEDMIWRETPDEGGEDKQRRPNRFVLQTDRFRSTEETCRRAQFCLKSCSGCKGRLLRPNAYSMTIMHLFRAGWKKSRIFLPFFYMRNVKTSTGEFRRMAVLEGVGGQPLARGRMGPMLSRQKELPPIPVAPLQETLDKYLMSLKLLLTTDQFEESQKVVSAFRRKNGEGEKLHKLLKEMMTCQADWFKDCWMREKFLKNRDPLLFNHSPVVVLPKQTFKSQESQLRYAASLVAGALDLKHLIDRQLLEPEMSAKEPLDMTQYQNIFTAYRVPRLNCDHLAFHPSKEGREEPSRDVLVIHNNQFFIINACDSGGIPYNEHRIMAQLLRVVDMSQADGTGLGLLTAANRDLWAKAYKRLAQNPKNAQSLEAIKNAALVLCLDKRSKVEEEPDEGVRQVFLGGSDGGNGANRWFDKTLQIIVDESGHNGILMEHTPLDGEAILALADHLSDHIAKTGRHQSSESIVEDEPRKLDFYLCADDLHDIRSAKSSLSSLRKDAELAILRFPNYGKDFIKSHEMSPDSFVQMAIELAFHKLSKSPGGLYQIVSARRFAHGRVSPCITTSLESLSFCRAFESNNSSAREREARLREAARKHKDEVVLTKNGLAVRPLLLGLMTAARERGMALPALYDDEGYRVFMRTHICSSQLPSRNQTFPFFGPMCPDGYGVNYRLQPDSMSFCITCYASCPDTSTTQWRDALKQSLLQMRNCLDGHRT